MSSDFVVVISLPFESIIVEAFQGYGMDCLSQNDLLILAIIAFSTYTASPEYYIFSDSNINPYSFSKVFYVAYPHAFFCFSFYDQSGRQ